MPLCLFRQENDIRFADELLALKDKGLIEAAGVSLVNPSQGWTALRIPGLAAWQIPTNVLDRRFTHSGLTAAAHAAGVTLFVEFLQEG